MITKVGRTVAVQLEYLVPARLFGTISAQHHKNVPNVFCGFRLVFTISFHSIG